MKENKFYSIGKNTLSIFKEWKNLAVFFGALIFFSGLYAFFYALITIPLPGGGVLGFYRMVPPTSFEVFYMIFSIIVSSCITAITVYSVKLKMKSGLKGEGISALGLVTGIFGSVCPACLGINLLAFGNVFTLQLSFLIPYIFWIQIGGISFLSLGLYLVAKSAYEKKCISCAIPTSSGNDSSNGGQPRENLKNSTSSIVFFVLIFVAAILLAYQLFTVFGGNTQTNPNISGTALIAKNGAKVNLNTVIETVTPKAGFETNVKWGDVVTKMIKAGVLDPTKLENILAKRYGEKMTPQWRDILAGKNVKLTINHDNAVFMMYLLWTLAKSNKNQILVDSPFVKYFKNYDIGVGKAGYGDAQILQLTPKQQKAATDVAQNASRPCCNNTTAQPDCSHGYSALGLVELMASQNFTKQQMFDTFVKFNSFWFPETYVKDALYFKLVKGQDWDSVNKELIAGKAYSSLSGAYKVKNYLKKNYNF